MEKFYRKILAGALAISLVAAPAAFARVLVGETVKTAFTFRPQALTATANGTAVDRLNYNSMVAVLDVGAVSGTSPTLNCQLQHATTSGGTYTNVTGGAFTQVTASNARQELSIDLASLARFVRAACTVGGTSPSFTMSLIFVLGEAGAKPLP